MRFSKVLAIHYYILGDTSLPEGVEDIVATHRRHNRTPRLPSNSQLAVVRHQQCSTSAPHTRAAKVQFSSVQGPLKPNLNLNLNLN